MQVREHYISEKSGWDDAADDYQRVFSLGLNDYNTSLLRFWQEERMIWPGSRVLDIGCGVGKYGTYLAELGCDVTLMDFSGEMLRLAAGNMAEYKTPWKVYEGDFNFVTGRESVFSGGFDLVISTMSPAVHNVETVQKMSALSRSYCFLARFQNWEQPVRDDLMNRMGVVPQRLMDGLSDDVASMIQAVSTAGFIPSVKHVPYCWSDARSPEEMADYLCRRYFQGADQKQLYNLAFTAAKEITDDDGLIHDAVNTNVAWIWWKTQK